MQLDKTMLDRLLSLDDAALARTILGLSESMGVDKAAAEAAVKNLRQVRRALAGASEGDLEKAVNLLKNQRPGGEN